MIFLYYAGSFNDLELIKKARVAPEVCLCLYVCLPSTGISNESITSNSLSGSGYDIQILRFARQVLTSPALSAVLIYILLMAEHIFHVYWSCTFHLLITILT